MNKVAYILGAGFSAYAGLPVMSNFLQKSKDMLYGEFSDKFLDFKNIFSQIQKLSVIKNYFQSDLFNIEEILSILEMESRIGKTDNSRLFIDYICKVIEFYSSVFMVNQVSKKGISNWWNYLFGESSIVTDYSYFVLSLFNVKIKPQTNRRTDNLEIVYKKNEKAKDAYSVVSLNYDLILERSIDNFKQMYNNDEISVFESEKYDQKWNTPHLAKLHGSIDRRNIIPPTWSKSINETILSSWKIALDVLRESNHIRIIGYSLPQSDAYIKYLLKAAIKENNNLKSIDVICLAIDNDIQNRYDGFIDAGFKKYFHFKNKPVNEYLHKIYMKSTENIHDPTEITLDKIEEAHLQFMMSP